MRLVSHLYSPHSKSQREELHFPNIPDLNSIDGRGTMKLYAEVIFLGTVTFDFKHSKRQRLSTDDIKLIKIYISSPQSPLESF